MFVNQILTFIIPPVSDRDCIRVKESLKRYVPSFLFTFYNASNDE